ncbi:GIY-YIG nuclease family protein [Thiomicrorhabdus sp. ZW0627]|uniref:GIY-YIG nuclease family protein n=1 Tax=Thiomicrorhabdus sp. ZW0627 TaxID=3039774 RepID=UPI0024368092|nr:GIY-YIG nuclease family protein [Thiomicrorhabdus sp. ZW0627]MDG6774556.1 GIY-YIG nuclease family protein [Thiomicrorhabdus sp. ZW0627]
MTRSDSEPTEKTEQAWWVYLLRCSDDSLYCGITNRLENRLRQHNGEIKGGARYTQARRPCELVYKETAASRQEALQREYAIKQLSRPLKEELVRQSDQSTIR